MAWRDHALIRQERCNAWEFTTFDPDFYAVDQNFFDHYHADLYRVCGYGPVHR